EVTVIVENARVKQLELGSVLAAAAILRDEPVVGKFPLRILVEHFQVGVRRRGVEVVVQFLDILAVVGLAVGQAEEALLEDRVAAIPECDRQTKPLLLIADAGDAVLAPAVHPAAGVVVGKVVPGGAVRTVILAYRSPLAFAQVRSPAPPRLPPLAVF